MAGAEYQKYLQYQQYPSWWEVPHVSSSNNTPGVGCQVWKYHESSCVVHWSSHGWRTTCRTDLNGNLAVARPHVEARSSMLYMLALPNVLFHFCIHTLFLCWAQYQAPFCYSQKMWSLVFVVFKKMDIPRVELAVVKVAVLLHVLCFVPEKWRSVQWGGWPEVTIYIAMLVHRSGGWNATEGKSKENLTIEETQGQCRPQAKKHRSQNKKRSL